MNVDTIYYLRNAISCLGFLIGTIGGIILVTRNKGLPGWLATIGFMLFGISELASFIFYRFYFNQLIDSMGYASFDNLNTIFSCITGGLTFVGTMGLIAALFTAVKPRQ